jgi:hypothetical protein
MFKQVFLDNNYSQILGILSVLVFMFIFVFRFVLSCFLTKGHVEKMSSLPLDNDLKEGVSKG